MYVKRILVDEKGAGTGNAALSAYLDQAFAREGVDCVWLIVRNGNERAQAVYRKLGFRLFTPVADEAARYDSVAEAPLEKCFRMRKLGPGLRRGDD
jgi:RimJ/RimL family protein N-acetyltransferase